MLTLLGAVLAQLNLLGAGVAQTLDLRTTALALLNIIIIDLVLSGDNAIVIGMAVQSLEARQRRMAILFGGGAALVLRVIFTAFVTVVIRERPWFVLAAGGLILIWITYRLLSPEKEEAEATTKAGQRGFLAAMGTIIVADVTMSLDNVLAVGVAAHGDPLLVLIGLILSMAILVAGGALVATILNRLPWLNYVGGLILLILVGDMIAHDPAVEHLVGTPSAADAAVLEVPGWLPWAITLTVAAIIAGLLYWRQRRQPAAPVAAAAAPSAHSLPDRPLAAPAAESSFSPEAADRKFPPPKERPPAAPVELERS